LCSIRSTTVILSAPFVFPTANTQYVRCYLVQCLIMFLLHLVTSMIGLFMLVLVKFMIYLFRNLIGQLPNYSTIQKPYYRQSVDFTMAGFTDARRPDKFTGVHFKRWQVKVRLW